MICMYIYMYVYGYIGVYIQLYLTQRKRRFVGRHRCRILSSEVEFLVFLCTHMLFLVTSSCLPAQLAFALPSFGASDILSLQKI